MKRKRFTLASVLSLVLRAATALLWVRARHGGLGVERGGGSESISGV